MFIRVVTNILSKARQAVVLCISTIVFTAAVEIGFSNLQMWFLSISAICLLLEH